MFLGIFLVLVVSYLKDHKYEPEYKIINSDEDNFCAEYPDGCIYIGDDDYLDSINTNDGDVLVEDLRIGKDPNMCIHDSYKIKEPYEIKPMNEQADMLTKIDALSFAMIDLQLYLDTHPTDRNMLSLFNRYREEKMNRVKEYETKYGSLTTNSDSLNDYPWGWIDEPWPWEG